MEILFSPKKNGEWSATLRGIAAGNELSKLIFFASFDNLGRCFFLDKQEN